MCPFSYAQLRVRSFAAFRRHAGHTEVSQTQPQETHRLRRTRGVQTGRGEWNWTAKQVFVLRKQGVGKNVYIFHGTVVLLFHFLLCYRMVF